MSYRRGSFHALKQVVAVRSKLCHLKDTDVSYFSAVTVKRENEIKVHTVQTRG
jgi:hypothetical protein